MTKLPGQEILRIYKFLNGIPKNL